MTQVIPSSISRTSVREIASHQQEQGLDNSKRKTQDSSRTAHLAMVTTRYHYRRRYTPETPWS